MRFIKKDLHMNVFHSLSIALLALPFSSILSASMYPVISIDRLNIDEENSLEDDIPNGQLYPPLRLYSNPEEYPSLAEYETPVSPKGSYHGYAELSASLSDMQNIQTEDEQAEVSDPVFYRRNQHPSETQALSSSAIRYRIPEPVSSITPSIAPSSSRRMQAVTVDIKSKDLRLAVAEENKKRQNSKLIHPKGSVEVTLFQFIISGDALTTEQFSLFETYMHSGYWTRLILNSSLVKREREDLSQRTSAFESYSAIDNAEFRSVSTYHKQCREKSLTLFSKFSSKKYVSFVKSGMVSAIPFISAREYLIWMSLIYLEEKVDPVDLQEISILLKEKVVGDISFFSDAKEVLTNSFSALPLEIISFACSKSHPIFSFLEWNELRKVHQLNFMQICKFFECGIVNRDRARETLRELQSIQIPLSQDEICALLNCLSVVAVSEEDFEAFYGCVGPIYGHDPMVAKKYDELKIKLSRSFPRKKTTIIEVKSNDNGSDFTYESSARGNSTVDSASEEFIEKVSGLREKDRYVYVLKTFIDADNGYRWNWRVSFTLSQIQRLVQVLPKSSVPIMTIEDGPGKEKPFLPLRDRLREFTGNGKWTARDLWHMDASLQMVFAAEVAVLLRDKKDKPEYLFLQEWVRQIYLSSSTHSIDENPETKASPLDRGISHGDIEKLFLSF